MGGFGPIFRNVVIPICGLLGILHETLISGLERPSLLVLFAAMIGLPAFTSADQKRRKD